jgi:hypothetical protein
VKQQIEKFVVYNLKETYHELGTYEFKVVLNPSNFKNGHESDVDFIDSDGKKMKFFVNRWGRKINCSFVIDDDVADGVSIVTIVLKDSFGVTTNERLTFWVVKPGVWRNKKESC